MGHTKKNFGMALAACTVSCSACVNGCKKALFCHDRLFELILLAQTLDNVIHFQSQSAGCHFESGCSLLDTVAHECWVTTGIYRGLPSSGFPQPFRLQADVCCSAEVWLLARRKTESSTFRKGQPLERSCAMGWRKLLMCVVDATYQQCSFYHKRNSMWLGVEKGGIWMHGPLVEIQETTKWVGYNENIRAYHITLKGHIFCRFWRSQNILKYLYFFCSLRLNLNIFDKTMTFSPKCWSCQDFSTKLLTTYRRKHNCVGTTLHCLSTVSLTQNWT